MLLVSKLIKTTMIFLVPSVALTLALTLTFENDMLCLLYYVYDIHASINLTNTH